MKTNDYAVQVDGRAWRIAREGARRRKAIGWRDALALGRLSKNASLAQFAPEKAAKRLELFERRKDFRLAFRRSPLGPSSRRG